MNLINIINMNCFLSFLAEDPYYSGLRARIPNFVRSRVSSAMSGAKGKVRESDMCRSVIILYWGRKYYFPWVA